MLTKMDMAFCVLLTLGGAGHIFGTIKFLEFGTGSFVWSLSGSLACFLLVAFNVLRIQHPELTSVAWIAFVGNLAWMGISTLFAHSNNNYTDPRFLTHFAAALGLAAFSGLRLFNL